MGKAATVITATLVAVFFSGLANAGRIYIPQRSAASSVSTAATASRTGDVLRSGAQEGVYIPAYNQDRQIPIKVLNSNDFSARRTFEAAADVLKSNRANAAAVAATAVVAAAVAGIDWIQTDGMYVKKTNESSPASGYTWQIGSIVEVFPNASLACNEFAKRRGADNTKLTMSGETTFYCVVYQGSQAVDETYVNRRGTSCSTGSTYNPADGGCYASSGTQPLTDADWAAFPDALDSASHAPDANPNFIKDLIRASCEGSLAPQRCFDSLLANGPGSASQNISGPSSVTVPANTSTTVIKQPDGTISASTTTNNTVINITYGNNYINHNSTTTKTKTNPDGSTETTTEEEPEESSEKYPEQPDPLSPVIKEYDKVTEAVKTPQETVAGLDSKAWFSFGGSCQELDLDTPIGHIKTNYCPTVESYVKPVLGFIFAVCAYLYCAAVWRETTMNVRPT